MASYGLIGRSLKHSFSQQYFTEFFRKEGLPHSYSNFELENVDDLKKLIENERLSGLNVTIPFKEDVIPLLDEIDEAAKEIGAVNVIKVEDGRLKGFNTDHIGFRLSLEANSDKTIKRTLILGSGGASKAVRYSLYQLGIEHQTVSRTGSLKYACLNSELISDRHLIINCTPLGTFPKVEEKPDIPYESLGSEHILFDLVYNPAETAFMKEGIKRGATVINGSEMLRIQAEQSWEIWSCQS